MINVKEIFSQNQKKPFQNSSSHLMTCFSSHKSKGLFRRRTLNILKSLNPIYQLLDHFFWHTQPNISIITFPDSPNSLPSKIYLKMLDVREL